MPDNESDDRPLQLRDLAQTESPEIVRAALGRFRRRLLVRGLIVVLVVAAGAILYPRYFNPPRDLTSEIQHARGVELLRSVTAGGVEATVVRVVRLSGETLAPDRAIERFGIQLAVFSRSLQPGEQLVSLLESDPDHGILSFRTGTSDNFALEMWMSFVAGTRSIDIPFVGVVSGRSSARLAHPSLGTLHIDMQQIGVPDWIWR